MNEDTLIGLLVAKVAGLQTNSPEWKKALQKAKYTLRYDKCTSTSEKEVNQRFDGLVERFGIKGHHDLSTALVEHKTEFLKQAWPLGNKSTNQSILKYDVLQLLLSLSSSLDQKFDYIPTIHTSEETTLTWQDVVEDDPLQGDHWQTWPENESTDDNITDHEDLEANDKTPNTAKPSQNTTSNYSKEFQFDLNNKMNIDQREDQEGLNYLVTQQYWREDYRLPSQNRGASDGSLLQNPCQLNDALEQTLYKDSQRSRPKVITESAVIREVISLLRGYHGVLFAYSDNQFVLNEDYAVQHISQGGLALLLQEFCYYGNIVFELRRLVDRVVDDVKYGQTSQAYAVAIYESLMNFDGVLSQTEDKASIITHNPSDIISILKLRSTLDFPLQCFKTIHEITAEVPYAEADPQEITTYLISALYDRALITQSSGQLPMYDMLLYIFQKTLVPYGNIMDDWVFHGSLMADKAKEFYVASNKEISISNPKFWVEGFVVRPIPQRDVCFPCPLFDNRIVTHIFFTGKAVNLLSQIEKTQHIQHYNYTQTSFSSLMLSYVPAKPSFIKPVHIESCKTSFIPQYDALTCALFSLAANKSDTEISPDIQEQPQSDLGSLFDQDFIRCTETYIREPYSHVADTLNNILHKECGLKQQLVSIASIYLMLENDLMHSFCESLFAKIDHNEAWFDTRILNRTFVESCEASGYDESVFIELKHAKKDSRVITPASYLELIDFRVEITWPLNNFIEEHHLSSYNKIQGFLLRLKRAKYVMEKKTLFRGRAKTERSDARAMHFYSIRMRILWFINAFWRYMMTTILHAETINFRDKLSISKDADEITALHDAYVQRIVDRCLLNDKASSIKKSITSILDMAEQMKILFAQYMQHSSARTDDLGQFDEKMNAIEKAFVRTNEFISISLMIMGKKGGLPWFEALASSLSAQ